HPLGTSTAGGGYRADRAGLGTAGLTVGVGWCPQKMHRWESGWCSFGQLGALLRRVAMAAPSCIPRRGPSTYTQKPSQCPAPHADPKVRAGFMLIPESGASKVM